MLFAAGGYKVSLYDIEPAQVSAAMEDIKVCNISFNNSNHTCSMYNSCLLSRYFLYTGI